MIKHESIRNEHKKTEKKIILVKISHTQRRTQNTQMKNSQ